MLAFIDYVNPFMAKPFRWTYKGKLLAASAKMLLNYAANQPWSRDDFWSILLPCLPPPETRPFMVPGIWLGSEKIGMNGAQVGS